MMAAASVSSVSHQVPPLSLSSIPRVRPPRIPKGTPNANTNPQPQGPVPHGQVWVQGKWRNPSSNAAKDRQQIQGRRVEKALKHATLGHNIYAYNHIRTNQVVYSLTRIMQNNKILPQLIFHGKKTVPAALRRDLWTPYFSLHFPPTPAGSSSGLYAYQQLRELAMQRQLSPPSYLITTTQADIDAYVSRFNAVQLSDMKHGRSVRRGAQNRNLKMHEKSLEQTLPKLGKPLPKTMLAKRLMDQKATSVADAAFVLGLMAKNPLSAEEQDEERQKRKERKFEALGKRAKRRVRLMQMARAAEMRRIAQTAAMVRRVDGNLGQLGLDKYTAQRIAMEFGGKATPDTGEVLGVDMAPKEGSKSSTNQDAESKREEGDSPAGSSSFSTDSSPITMLWADLRDGTHAESWPSTVLHGSLTRAAVAQYTAPVLEKNKTARLRYRVSKSVHIIGTQMTPETDPVERMKAMREERQRRLEQKRDDDERKTLDARLDENARSGQRQQLEQPATEKKSLWSRSKSWFGLG